MYMRVRACDYEEEICGLLNYRRIKLRCLYSVVIGKTAIKIYGFSGGIRPGVGLQGGIRATSRLQ